MSDTPHRKTRDHRQRHGAWAHARAILFGKSTRPVSVTIFNAEPRVNYDRIMLSPVLSGEKSYEQIVNHGDGWYIDHGIGRSTRAGNVAIDRAAATQSPRPRRHRAR